MKHKRGSQVGPGMSVLDWPHPGGEASALIQHWVARLLMLPQVWKRGWCVYEKRFDRHELLTCLGLRPSEEGRLRNPPKALADLARPPLLGALLADDAIYGNLARLGERLGLSEAERRLLTFTCHMQASPFLYEACELMPSCSHQVLMSYLATFLSMEPESVTEALKPDGILRVSNLLRLNLGSNFRGGDLTTALEVEQEFSEVLHTPHASDAILTGHFYRQVPPASLDESDYVERQDEIALLRRLLRQAVEQRQRGINILLYGPPGTGKTQLASVLATALNYPLAAVPELDSSGEAILAHSRLGRYSACQRALEQDRSTLVLFDEAEECLCDGSGFMFFASPRKTPKAAVVRMLDDNPRPTLWISNRADMDPAFLRRFTHVVRLDNPGPHQRRRLVQQALADMPVSEKFLDAAARLDRLTPALLHSAVAFAQLASHHEQDMEHLLAHNLNARLEAQGEPHRLCLETTETLPWRAAALRASEDVASLLESVRPELPVRFCLYGPPGTGKTAWAHQLAGHLDKPLMLRQASDLLGMYVGETEKRIAQTFAQAEREGAVLLIDEADSFISSRHDARQHWEASQVNQFLASMEQYQGLFIATTNLLERMDEAAMRRFDFTIRFDYLDMNGALLLLADLAQAHSIQLPEQTEQRTLLRGLEQLTPGDFAALHRRLRIYRHLPDAAGLAQMLREAGRYKTKGARPIGFAAVLR